MSRTGGLSFIVLMAFVIARPLWAHDEGPRHHHHRWDEEHRKAEVRRDVAWHAYEGAEALAEVGSPEDALGMIDQAIKLDPREGRFQLTKGFILRDLDRTDDAMMALREAQRLSTGWILEEASEELAHLQEGAGSAAPGSGPAAGASGAGTPQAGGGADTGAPPPGGGGGEESKAVAASLYTRLGGESALRAVADEFHARVAADTRINAFFKGVDMEKLKRNLVALLGQATGGPQVYKGRSMKEAHAGMKISDADFDALVEDLVAALDKFKVPAAEKKELLEILGPMRADIVEVKGKGK